MLHESTKRKVRLQAMDHIGTTANAARLVSSIVRFFALGRSTMRPEPDYEVRLCGEAGVDQEARVVSVERSNLSPEVSISFTACLLTTHETSIVAPASDCSKRSVLNPECVARLP